MKRNGKERDEGYVCTHKHTFRRRCDVLWTRLFDFWSLLRVVIENDNRTSKVTLITLKCFNILSCYIFIWLFDQRKQHQQRQQEELCICNSAFYGVTKPHVFEHRSQCVMRMLTYKPMLFFHQINISPSDRRLTNSRSLSLSLLKSNAYSTKHGLWK